MPNISNRHYSHPVQRVHHSRWRMPLRVIVVGFGVIFFVNLVLVVLFLNKVPANVRLGNTSVGGMSYKAVQALPTSAGIESQLTLRRGSTNVSVRPAQLGLSVDRQASYEKLHGSYIRWVPITSYLHHVTVPVVLAVNQSQFNVGITAMSGQFERAPQDVHIAFNGSQFVRAEAMDGYKINATATQKLLLSAVASGQSSIQIPTQTVKTTVHNIDLSADITNLNKQLATTVSYAAYGGKRVVPTATDRAAWYVPSGQSVAFSKQKVAEYLDKIAASQSIQLLNKADLTTATYYALTHQQKLDFRMVTTGNHLRTYCTAARGVAASALGELNDKLAAVYADARGWNDQGLVGFEHVESGCQYTVWLSAADQVTSFGSICDNYYNCQVGGSVVVNYDRWTSATPPWNQTGGNIEDYRVLIINHETGHRLGFLDNPVCPGAGQPAYVMMQQSIELKGCAFNIWPTQTELTQLKSML